jgi:O-antigen/teichoic acid export membrane protein
MKLGTLRRNVLLQISVVGTGYLSTFFHSALVGRKLGRAELGAYTATAAAASIVMDFTTLGIDSPIARRIATEPERATEWLDNAVGIRLLVSFPVALVVAHHGGLQALDRCGNGAAGKAGCHAA